jgi:methyl-accepting chemotaxis protein
MPPLRAADPAIEKNSLLMATDKSRARGLGIFGKLFLAFLLAALVPLLITWYFARERAVEDAAQLGELQLRSTATRLADKVESWLRINQQSLAEHAATQSMQTMRPEIQKPILISLSLLQPWSFLVFTIGPDGMSVARNDNLAPINYSDRGYFKDVSAGKTLGQQVVISRTINKPTWVVAVPIRDTYGRFIGALAKSNALSEITDVLVNERIGRTGKALLLAPDGKLIAQTGAVMDKELLDLSAHPAFKAGIAGNEVARYIDDGRPMLARIRKTRLDWVVAVQMPEEEVFERVRATDIYMVELLAIAVVVAAIFALIVAPGIANPIRRLTTITEDISRGNFEQEVKEASRSDEIGALARSIERMTKSLRIALARLSDKRS